LCQFYKKSRGLKIDVKLNLGGIKKREKRKKINMGAKFAFSSQV
jgi:hypothetical protein